MKKPKKPACTHMDILCPPWGFHVSLSWHEAGAMRYLRDIKKQGAEGDDLVVDDSASGLCWGSHVWLRETCPSSLLHELHHVVSHCLAYMGVEDEECEAYLQSWLFRKVIAKWGVK